MSRYRIAETATPPGVVLDLFEDAEGGLILHLDTDGRLPVPPGEKPPRRRVVVVVDGDTYIPWHKNQEPKP